MSLRDIVLAMQCICIIGVFAESVVIVKRWKNELHLYLLLSSIALLLNEIGTLLELTAETGGELITALKFAYFGRVWYVFFLFLFVAELTRVKVPKVLKNILILIHMATYGVILTIPHNGLYYTNIEIQTGGMFLRVVHGNGIAHHILMTLQMLYTLVGIFFLIRAYLKARGGRSRIRLLTVFIAMLTESIFFAVQLIGIPGLTEYYDVTMLGFFIGTILMLVAIFSLDLLGTIDIAKEFVIDKISEGIIAVDNDGKIQYFNAPAAKLWPALGSEGADTAALLADIKTSVAEGSTLSIGGRVYTTKENDLVYGGEALGKLYALVDDTEHYAYMEELEKQKAIADSASEAKSLFLANMSHEIRTPINAVLGFDEMILRETQEKSIRTYAADIMSAGKTLLSLINDILDFSKVEAGKFEIIPAQYELSSLINDLNNMIKDVAAKKGLKFILDVDAQTPHLLVGDEIRIRQCVMNLLTNAVKYTETGSVTMRVGFHDVSADEINLHFSVKDTGIGMKQEDMKDLFSPYKRIDEAKNRWVQGTGLGMGITKELLKLMGSSLDVQSEYGKGTTFSFAVKQQVVSRDEIGDFAHRLDEASRGESVYRALFQAPSARILVVDDTEMNLSVIQNLLKKTKIRIDTALSGRDAIALAASTEYDAAFFDHMMPDMDGIETLAAFRKTEKNQKTPAVALTANAISGARRMYLNAGFTDYLSKPVDGIKLEKMLLSLLPKEKIEKPGAPEAEPKHRPGSETSKILVIDDDEAVGTLIKTVLQPLYDISVSLTGADAVRLARSMSPDLIMLDIHLADSNGFSVMQELKNDPQTADIPVLLVTGDNDASAEENGFRSGASDYIRKPFVPDVLKQRVKRIVDLYHYQQSIEREVEKQTSRSKRLTREMMLALSKAVDTKDHYTDGHSRRVAALCAEIGRRLGKNAHEQIELYEIGLLHDIGKIGVHEDIIRKSARLSDAEFEIVKSHAVNGYEILKEITDMPRLCDGARWHHERFDGTGYPDGLKGAEIPEAARIVCIADCYDAMASTRTYSLPKTQSEIRAEIVRCRGTWFDPQIADVLLAMIDEDTAYRMNENANCGDIWKEYNRLWNDNGGSALHTEAAQPPELPDFIYALPDVDTEAGIKNCGTADGYLSVLTVFHQTAEAKAAEIDALHREGKTELYTIKVHALKSSARIIGAGKLSQLAAALENAGKKNEVDFIREHTPRLLAMYRSLDRELAALDADRQALPDIGPDALEEAYQTIVEIAGSMDYGLMAGILDELKNYSKPAADTENFKKMERMLNELDWDGISAAAASAIRNTEDSDGE
ncbi:MAG: response regulator [Ruminococcaceae bacterium]|nr:response regulator [Oscillospiraceae bacterium]